MGLPEHVLTVGGELKANNDERLPMFIKLTESRFYLKELKDLWWEVYKTYSRFHYTTNETWVYEFLDTVISATNLPNYYYLSKKEREEKLKDIEKYTLKLSNLYKGAGLDADLITNEGQFFAGFQSHPDGDFKDFSKCDSRKEKRLDKKNPSKVSITETLNYFHEFAIEELGISSFKGNKAEDIKAIRFMRLLAQHNKDRYGEILEETIRILVLIIYKKEYSDKKEFLKVLKRY